MQKLRSNSRKLVPAFVGLGTLVAGFLVLQIGFLGTADTAPVEMAADRQADGTANRGSARTPLTSSGVVGAAAETTTTVAATEVPTTEVPTTVPVTAPPLTAPPTTAAPVTTTTAAPAPAASLRVETATPEAAPAVEAAPAPVSDAAPTAATDVWTRLAKCESGIRNDGGAPYYGYFQFSAATWRSVGGTGLPNDHSYATQLEMAKKLQARSGWGQWPVCSKVALG